MYKLHLILKYLLKRRIAWVSLLAVMLCTMMVLVVISVMGGWLTMFRQSFHGLSGDIVVGSESVAGFPYYHEMIDAIEKQPDVIGAVPVIQTFGLFSIGSIPTGAVQVLGLPIDRIGEVNRFPDSLYLQHTKIADELKLSKLTPDERARLEEKLKEKPSFNLLDRTTVVLDKLPADVKIADATTNQLGDAKSTLWYDAARKRLLFRGVMKPDQRDALRAWSADAGFRSAIDSLYDHSNDGSVIDYPAMVPRAKQDVTRWPGMIPGIGVVGIVRDRDGNWISRLAPRDLDTPIRSLYAYPVKLTVLGINPGEGLELNNKAERSYWIVDTSRTQIWQYDSKCVYVPFDQLQMDLGMSGKSGVHDLQTGAELTLPARTSQIHVRVKPGVNLTDAKARISKIVDEISRDRVGGDSPMYVETWEESQSTYLSAIENEKILMVFLFGIISLVAIFLIFCIFYMIVMEKTRDIGIIKSVGATSLGVATIFLGYGLVIGIIGAAMGLLCSFLLIHNINELHTLLGKLFGIVIWNPEVYLFDTIPNTMAPRDVIVICSVAVLSSVLGALVPAIRAARMNPVEALRWE